MATFRPPFAYNTGEPISGTTQYGNFVIGNVEVDYSSDYGGVKWWASPEEITGFVIGTSRPGGQPVPSGVTGKIITTIKWANQDSKPIWCTELTFRI